MLFSILKSHKHFRYMIHFHFYLDVIGISSKENNEYFDFKDRYFDWN